MPKFIIEECDFCHEKSTIEVIPGVDHPSLIVPVGEHWGCKTCARNAAYFLYDKMESDKRNATLESGVR